MSTVIGLVLLLAGGAATLAWAHPRWPPTPSTTPPPCDAPTAGQLAKAVVGWLSPFLLYAVFRAVARRSLPPQLVGVDSRGWHPR